MEYYFQSYQKKYASYKTPNDGDLGWFKEKVMVATFEKSVKEHKKGDIYMLDIPERDWYYVVLKTHNDRENNILKLIRIKCCS